MIKLPSPARRDPLALELKDILARDPIDLAAAALTISKIEYPDLDPGPYLETLDRLGSRAREVVSRVPRGSVRSQIAALNQLVFQQERFSGNHAHYDDFRNSFLNAVLERRLGIPITLALVYMAVADRAGLDVQGVAFPGHFLMHVTSPDDRNADASILLDPFDAGVELDVDACRRLLTFHSDPSGDEPRFDPRLLRPCTRRHMIARVLNNLKRSYVELRAFSRARRVTDLLLGIEPMLLSELRDRGLLSYHLDDFSSAMRDLEDYLRLQPWRDDAGREEREQITEHLKMVRHRLASLN